MKQVFRYKGNTIKSGRDPLINIVSQIAIEALHVLLKYCMKVVKVRYFIVSMSA
jgi:hypothetical protein